MFIYLDIVVIIVLVYGLIGVNANTLPSGVSIVGHPNYLKTSGFQGRYGGTSFKTMYNVTSTSTSDTFCTNPKFYAYPSGSEFYPGTGGVRFGIDVRVYSKGGTRYMWRRTA